jgi:uncharacterized FlaG/YvyC family protein
LNFSPINNHISSPTESAMPQALNVAQRALVQAVKAINPTELFGEGHAFNFVMDQKSKTLLVRIVDKKTGQIISQIPAEYMLRLAEENKGS